MSILDSFLYGTTFGENAAAQFKSTAAQELQMALQLRNVYGNRYNILMDIPYIYHVPSGWQDWFDYGDELI